MARVPSGNPNASVAKHGGRRLAAVFITALLVPLGVAVADPGNGRSSDTIVVRFEDAARVRLAQAGIVSLAGADLRDVQRVLREHPVREIRPLFTGEESEIEAKRRFGEARSGRALPDLNSYFEIVTTAQRSEELLRSLRQIPAVKTAYRAALPAPPPVDIPPTTPDGESGQLYLDPAPEGVDARYAWTRPGGRGEGIYIVDIERSWRTTHEDLDTALGTVECYTPGVDFIEHGTAVLGQLVGGDNGYGVTGIANQANVGLVTDGPIDLAYSVARAIQCGTELMQPGDVLLLEAQTVGPHGNFVPVEYNQAEYDAIVVAVAAGIVVVSGAANGNEDLDHVDFGGLFDRSVRDSGAIIVGAGADLWYTTQPDRSRLDFSTYGSRVDVQGWGDDVVTTGYGDAFDGDGDPNQYYTEWFNGTSSASGMIAGVAASLQGVQIACGGSPLTSPELREILVSTGSPQVAGPYPGNIGPRPDLRAALDLVETDNDTDGWAECQGDCDDATAETHPGALETNDGLDNQCPGEYGYGGVDETSPDSGFHDPADKNVYSWTAQTGAATYEVSRSDAPDFSTGCQRWETSATAINDPEVPASGGVFHYLNHPLTPHAGSWGLDSSPAERSGPCL